MEGGGCGTGLLAGAPRPVRFDDGGEWTPPGCETAIWRWDGPLVEATGGEVPLAAAVGSRGLLDERLSLARGIGPVRERRLREEGWRDLQALSAHRRWGPLAEEARRMLAERRVDALRRRQVHDGEILGLFRAEELLFFDLEAMGLAPVFPVFLAGLARWDGRGWRSTLLLARHFDEERALLLSVAGELRRSEALVTYNGRGYDVPFMAMRSAYHGIDAWETGSLRVLDLLSEARRRFRGVLPDARLETVDRFLSGRARPPSLPSSLVPEYYQRWVQTGDQRFIEPILHHNTLDLAAMVRLWAMLVPEGASGGLAG